MQHDYPWGDCQGREPFILPDTGAKDGLCGDRWAIHAGQWARQRGHRAIVDNLPQRKHVSGVGNGTQTADERITLPIGLESTDKEKHLSTYRAAVVRNSDLPALLGINSLEKMNAVIRCRTGELWFFVDAGCDIKPKGHHIHLQMEKGSSGHWYLPVGRFSAALHKMGAGHLATATATAANDATKSSANKASAAAATAE